jgi:tetratricopeptide (TPR) repeat protein
MSAKHAFLIFFGLSLSAPVSFGQTATAGKDQSREHMQRAQQDLAERRPDLAVPELQKVIELDPGNIEARGNLGVLLFFRGDYKGAEPQLRAAVQAKPGLWKIQALLGLTEARLQEPDASRSDMATAFPHLDQQSFQLDVGKALVDNYTATEDLDKAAAAVAKLLETRPTDASLLYLSYRLYSDLAGRAMLTLALAAPNSAEMHQVMARELARHGDYTPAIANYREALRINPELPGLHSELADLLYHSEDQKLQMEAKSEFEAALAVNPRDEHAEIYLGMIAAQNGDMKTALADDSRAVDLAPGDTDAYTELAKVLVLMNQKDKAEEMLEHAVQIDPTNYVAHYRLAGLYRQEGKTDKAREQVADYQKYRQMKDTLEKIFQDMRVASGQHPESDDAGGMR